MAPAITATSDSHSVKLDEEGGGQARPAGAHAPLPSPAKSRPAAADEPEPLLSEDDLLQVLKTMEENKGEVLGHLLGLELLEAAGPRADDTEARLLEAVARQQHLQRRLERLQRTVRKKQARNIGLHSSLQIYEMVTTTKALLKARGAALRLHGAAAPDDILDPDHVNGMSQRALASLVKQLSSGGGSGASATVAAALSHEQAAALAGGSGQLGQRLQHVEAAFDSDATASSSGGDSADEAASFPYHNTAKAPIQKRAAWRFARERASAASRWAWLTANIAELEYRIRQLNDYQRQVRSNKGAVSLKDAQGAPGAPEPLASRVAPLDLAAFRKRKLFVPGMLTPKTAKRACSVAAQPPCCRDSCSMPCVLCFPKKGVGGAGGASASDVGGRETLRERAARLDPAVHPVLSANSDVGRSLHMAATLRMPGWQQAQLRTRGLALKRLPRTPADPNAAASGATPAAKRKYNKNSSHANAISAKLRKKAKAKVRTKVKRVGGEGSRDGPSKKGSSGGVRVKKVSCSLEEASQASGGGTGAGASAGSSAAGSQGLLHELRRKKRENSYDIDNIVIPYSMAALTRVEKLEYKEILTPKWRVAQVAVAAKKAVKAPRPSTDESEVEDISDEAVTLRHEPLELEERRKFRCVPQRSAARNKRTDSRAESSGANTPDPMSPSNFGGGGEGLDSPLTSPRATPLPLEELGRSKERVRRRTASLLLLQDGPQPPPLPPPSTEECAPGFEPRVFPLTDEQCQQFLDPDGDEEPPAPAPAPDLQVRPELPFNDWTKPLETVKEAIEEKGPSTSGEGAAGAVVGPPSPCSSASTESALPEDDPEWTLDEPEDDDEDEDFKPRGSQ
ncbi:Hypothetical predicted protein [Cloeon dipterum]|uniref:PEHE domain-containing protein n=1 Tax=Cloeon dipterum TaxID=197152 RepID=A0A8S1DWT6_9INSE|nr:Hypothetical predicted protein [Cloeon dipterum]